MKTCSLVPRAAFAAALSAVAASGQPATPPPVFETNTEMGLVRVGEIAQVRTFDGVESADPYLRLTVRVERKTNEVVDPILVSVTQALDDAGSSVVPQPGSRAAQIATIANSRWGGGMTGVALGDGKGKSWSDRPVFLLAPQPQAMTLSSLVLSISYSIIDKWEEIAFDPKSLGPQSAKEQGWARASLQTLANWGTGATQQMEVSLHLKRVKGDIHIGTYLFRYLVRDAGGKEFPGYLWNAAAGDDGFDLFVRWTSLPADFQPAQLVFRFPSSVDTKTVEASFKDIPLP